jgi:hypothetical protein
MSQRCHKRNDLSEYAETRLSTERSASSNLGSSIEGYGTFWLRQLPFITMKHTSLGELAFEPRLFRDTAHAWLIEKASHIPPLR